MLKIASQSGMHYLLGNQMEIYRRRTTMQEVSDEFLSEKTLKKPLL